MERIILFALLSLPVIVVSWRTLFDPRSHGFYRFISWECIIWLFVNNYRLWFYDALSLTQIFSWLFLIISGYLVVIGAVQLERRGKPGRIGNDSTLYEFENTSELVDTGIYRFIRHPLYSSLLFLTWGIFLKDASGFLLVIAFLSSISLYITAKVDERECITRFGEKYKEYMTRSKMFIPYIL